jgi:hypothetical protein
MNNKINEVQNRQTKDASKIYSMSLEQKDSGVRNTDGDPNIFLPLEF